MTVPLDTVLIDLEVKDTSPTRARDIANEIARQSRVVMQALVSPPGAERLARQGDGHSMGHDPTGSRGSAAEA